MIRIGQGYDVHRLSEGRKLIIGGVEIPFELGLLGHSDADAGSGAAVHGGPRYHQPELHHHGRQDPGPLCETEPF